MDLRQVFTSACKVLFYILISPINSLILTFVIFKGNYEKIKAEKIKWAPLCVPMRRRLEAFSMGVLSFIVYLFMPVVVLVTVYLLIRLDNFWRLIIILIWIYNHYDNSKNFSVLDGVPWRRFRTSAWARLQRSYFPVELIKTAELKPNKNYILACYPHGILSIGPSVNMISDVSKWLELYPGIRPKVVSLDFNFGIPLMRHYMIYNGYVTTAKEGLLYFLNKSNDPKHKDNRDGFTSYALAIAVGGAKEASETRPGHYKISIKNRKGFVKIAIMSGASIVPSFTFNEVDSYEQIFATPGSFTHRFQQCLKSITRIWPTLFVGRGFFQYSFGLMPHRNRLVQVVGAPIDVQKHATPDPAYVDEIHEKVILAIQEIFDKYKERYLDKHKDANLIIT